MGNKSHTFNIEDAVKYDVELATILYNFRFWLEKNKADGRNIHDGRVWTYNTASKFTEIFPYFSQDQIQRRLKKLEEDGILLVGNYNEAGYDRTKWYSINEPEFSIQQHCDTHSAISPNGLSETAEPIPDNKPDNKTIYPFDDFWDLYDKKKQRASCEKKWDKLSENDKETIMEFLPIWNSYEQHVKENGKYKPHPSTFLNQKRWEDDWDEYRNKKSLANDKSNPYNRERKIERI